jgi:predicted porin
MNKVFLTMLFAFSTMIASAQFVALTTVNKVEGIEPVKPSTTEVYEGDVCPTTETDDSWNVTDKIGIGYQVNEKLMVGVTKDGDDDYELLGRYSLMNGVWGTCIYNYTKDSEDEMMDRLDLGVGYSYNVWRGLWVDPNYTMPLKEDEEGNREGSFNLSFSYKF